MSNIHKNMNLIIDVGNTYTKIGIFDDSKIIYKTTIQQENLLDTLQDMQSKYTNVTHAIISSVSNIHKKQIAHIKRLYHTLVLDHSTKIPFKNLYETPTTLGIDRIALVAAATHQFPDKNVLIIDVGTCITYDFKNKKEEYLGGAIAPGIQLRYNSLHHYTAKLPLLSTKMPKNTIGKTTEQSMHSGVIYGILYEIEGTIAEYRNIYDDLTVILTGGDAHFLSKRLKNGIFATSNFLLEGLNCILAFNNNR